MTFSCCFCMAYSPTISVFARTPAPSDTLLFRVDTDVDQRRADEIAACSAAWGVLFCVQIAGMQAKTGGNLHEVNHPRIGCRKHSLLVEQALLLVYQPPAPRCSSG